jgi:prepilin-type N-terminal cleavage/methylation domain-containing protein
MRKKEKMNVNNKGFSLVEVLLAVVILGLIAAPILQMFYTSYQINNKSKRMLNAAELAQTTMEALTSQTYGESKTVKGTLISEGLAAQYQESYDQRASVKYANSQNGRSYYGYLFDIPFGDAATNDAYHGPGWQYATKHTLAQTLGYLKSDGTPFTLEKEWEEYYFQNIDYPSGTKDPLCAIIRFDKKNYVEGEVGVVEVEMIVYGYTKDDLKANKQDTPGYFDRSNLGSFDKLEEVRTYIPSVRLD